MSVQVLYANAQAYQSLPVGVFQVELRRRFVQWRTSNFREVIERSCDDFILVPTLSSLMDDRYRPFV